MNIKHLSNSHKLKKKEKKQIVPTTLSDSNCPNCLNLLLDQSNFCSNCGQDTHTIKLPFKHIVLDFLEGLFHFDTKFWLTMKQLFKNPGIVINEYNSNKRVRYVPPIRLYIFVSVLFFILANNGINKKANDVTSIMENDLLIKGFTVTLFSTTRVDLNSAKKLAAIPHITEKQVDSILTSASIKASSLNIKIIQNLIQLKRKEISAHDISHKFMTGISKVLFILMPVFAFIIWLIVNPRKLYFMDTLIYSIYFHSFYFILMIMSVLLNLIFTLPFLYSAVYLLACVYSVPSIRTAFGLTWIKSSALSVIIILIYTTIFAIVFATALISSLVL